MKKILLLLLSVFALNATNVYSQELTKEELKTQAKEKKAAEKAAKEAEKQREKQAKKLAKREAQYAKFVEMVNNWEAIELDTKNVAELDTLIKHLNETMVRVVALEEAYNSVEMVSEPYVDEDGIPDTLWYARDKDTKERYTNEEAEKLLKAQKNIVVSENISAGLLVVYATSALAGIAAAKDLNTIDKLALTASASTLTKQAKLIKYGLTSMKYHLNKNMEYLGFQIDNEGEGGVSEDELDNMD